MFDSDPYRPRPAASWASTSDARYRFERGVDPESALWGAAVASAMILDLCGGEASTLTIAGDMPESGRSAALRIERLAKFGGADIPLEEARTILDRLGFETSMESAVITARIPSWRPDVEGEHSLVEEVLRVWGYDRIPAVPLERETALPTPALSAPQRRVAFARRALASRGMMEAVTWSFTGKATAALFAEPVASLVLANPISADLDVMRPSALANLLAAAQRNADRGFSDLALFEVGAAWRDDTPEGQDTVGAALRHGQTGPRHWAQEPRAVDAFDAKADALAVLAQCGAPADNLQVTRDAPRYYHPGRSGALRLGPNVLAWFGEIHPRVLRRLDVAGPAVAAEVYIDLIPQPKGKVTRTRPALEASPFQTVTRDFAFLVGSEVEAGALQRAARNADRALIVNVGVFDVFEGEVMGEGRKSVAISVTLQPVEHTLTDAEIEAVSAKIIGNVGKHTGGTLRG